MRIEEKFKDIQTLTEMHALISPGVKAGLTWTGYSYISIQGFEGTLPIDALAQRVEQILQKIKYQFPEEERAFAKNISNIIDRVYEDYSHNHEKANCITRLFFGIRELFYHIIHRKWILNEDYWESLSGFHNFYTKKQYLQVFQTLPDTRPSCFDRGMPDRWSAPPTSSPQVMNS